MKTLKIIKHSMSVEYICPVKNVKHSTKIENPNIQEGWYYSDWSYKYIDFRCPLCGEKHEFEI